MLTFLQPNNRHMTEIDRIKQSMEEDYKITIDYIEEFFDKFQLNFRINPGSKGFIPDVFHLGMEIKQISPDGVIQAEINQEMARRRYKTVRPKSYEDRIKRAIKLAFKGTGVKLAKIIHPDAEVAEWQILLTYPEGTVFHNDPFLVIESCSATEILADLDLSQLEYIEASYTEPDTTVPTPPDAGKKLMS